MAGITGEYSMVREAFTQPTLTLLHQTHAPAVIAVLRTSFPRETRDVPSDRLHQQVDAYFSELRLSGHTDIPIGTGRELCKRWMHGQWLVRSTLENGNEVYSLTSHAQDALLQVMNLTRERTSGVTEHRIATIVAAVRRFNTSANPDRSSRIAILEEEIGRLTRERDRLAAGGDIEPASADYMIDGYGELLSLVDALPGDFARVEERFTRLRGEILAGFREDDRPAGEVVDTYLSMVEDLASATAEGRAFEGAFALLRDEGLQQQLREDLRALLHHPSARDILEERDRRALRDTVGVINRGVESVLAQRQRVTAALRDYIITHDLTRDRELDVVLRQLDTELTSWLQTTGPRATVPADLQLLPARSDVGHLKERFYDPTGDAPPPPLADVRDQQPAAVDLQQLLAQGGPSFGTLRQHLLEALKAVGPDSASPSIGDIFAALGEDMRRPVEVLGLLHLVANDRTAEPADGTEQYDTVRPDGTRRQLTGPRLVLTPAPSEGPLTSTSTGTPGTPGMSTGSGSAARPGRGTATTLDRPQDRDQQQETP